MHERLMKLAVRLTRIASELRQVPVGAHTQLEYTLTDAARAVDGAVELLRQGVELDKEHGKSKKTKHIGEVTLLG